MPMLATSPARRLAGLDTSAAPPRVVASFGMGVDSTAMLGFAVGTTDHPLRSFTLGFSDPGIVDERPFAQLAAKRYGADHHEILVRPDSAEAEIQPPREEADAVLGERS